MSAPEGRWHWDGHIGRFAQIKNGVVIHKWPDEMDKYASSLEAEVAALREALKSIGDDIAAGDMAYLKAFVVPMIRKTIGKE